MQTSTEVKDALRIILTDRDSYSKSLNYAVNYCREALRMDDADLRMQCLYILNNISRWRHPQARKVRTILKAYCKT